MRGSSARRALGTLIAVAVVAVAVGLVVAVGPRDTPSSRARARAGAAANVSTQTTAPGSDATATSIGPTPAELAEDNAPVNAGPFPVPAFGAVPAGATGGPYISSTRARDVALQDLGCSLGGPQSLSPTDTGCLRVDVTFFKRYADAWTARGQNGGFVVGWGPDHEMYVVTVSGKLALITRGAAGPTGPGHDYLYTDQRTYQIDATTGEILLSGGIPLPLTTAGLVSYKVGT